MTEANDHPTAADRLSDGLERLHVPQPSADAEAMLTKAAVALPVIGLVLILVAYWQAAGAKYVADQIPMLISGGLVGLGLITIGLGLFVRFSLGRILRFWLARQMVEQQAQTDRIVEALGNVERAVRDAASDQSAAVRVPDARGR